MRPVARGLAALVAVLACPAMLAAQVGAPAAIDWSADDSARIAYLTSSGRAYTGAHVIVWAPPDSLDPAWLAAFTDSLERGVAQLRALIGGPYPWQQMGNRPVRYYLSPGRFVSHADGHDGVFISLTRVRQGGAPWLHEAAHEILSPFPPFTPFEYADSAAGERAAAAFPYWLNEGLPDVLAQRVKAESGFPEGDVFAVGGLAKVDSACATRLTASSRRAEILERVGRPGRLEALFTTERAQVAPVYYACAQSFTKHLVEHIGLPATVALFPHIPDGTWLRMVEAAAGAPLERLRSDWLRTLHLDSAPASQATPPMDSAMLRQVADLIEPNYWRALPRESILAVLANGGPSMLDPYSRLLSPADYAELTTNLRATFGGVGARIEEDSATHLLRVLGTFPGSPAQAAGLRPGDLITAIGNRPTAGMSFFEKLDALRGPVGSEVRLSVRRAGRRSQRHLVIRRALIHAPSVRGAQHEPLAPWDYRLGGADSIAYVRIMYFAEPTPAELDSALARVRADGARALIIDLRDNSGGPTASAIRSADLLLDSGVVVTFRGRAPPDDVERAAPGAASRVPLALLVNERTASAAELFAAALQDNGRAVVVGSRTYGKAMVQRLLPLPDSGALRLTVAAYVRPSGAPIERHVAGVDSARGGVWPSAGLTVVLTPAEDSIQSGPRQDGDGFGLTRESRVLPPQRDRDDVLAAAWTALLGKLQR